MLVMTHVHCDLKKRINDEFISLGLTQPIIIDRNVVYDNENNEYDSNNTKPIQSNYYEKELNYAE